MSFDRGPEGPRIRSMGFGDLFVAFLGRWDLVRNTKSRNPDVGLVAMRGEWTLRVRPSSPLAGQENKTKEKDDRERRYECLSRQRT